MIEEKLCPMDEVWPELLWRIMHRGREVAPRGKPTKELPMETIVVNMRRPVLTLPERKLSYQFMAAEAYWMLAGDDTVAGIAPWNKNISQFSDDGERFFGAYGPKILDQFDYVVGKLLEDHDTRQAGLTIWREKPPRTKDVPCTVAMFFAIRDARLEMSVFMRSNDAWLGTPYDVFNFSMVGHLVCCRLNQASGQPSSFNVTPGALRLTAASSHLYEPHWGVALELASKDALRYIALKTESTPVELFLSSVALRDTLQKLRDSKPGDPLRWWEVKP